MNKEQLLLYAVTDPAWVGKLTLLEQIEQALEGGVTMLQLREKNMNHEDLIQKAVEVKKLCRRYGVPLIINDNAEAAIESGADGVHVGIEDMAVREIRQRVGKQFIIGATAKTVEQARKAQAEGADYLGVGAVFPSPTKKDAIRITGEQLAEITASVSIPCVAIGGISKKNIMEITGTGICGAALVSAVFAAEQIKSECRELRLLIEQVVRSGK